MVQTFKETRAVRRTQDKRAALREMNDEDLMALFQQGTIEAFNILVERYSERLGSYLYRFVKDWEQVEDLLQETFLRLHRNRHAYRPIARFSTWLYTIAGNLARSEYRKKKRERRHIQPIESSNRDGEDYEMPLPDLTFAPDRAAERVFQHDYIQQALNEVPDEFREVVVLRDVQQLTYEEIADITGLPMGTVKSRINRGRSKLQTLLADVYPFNPN